ncbi:MAG: SUMF1/EgtB/PvdO family nonheme iron enzyme [Anaerolineae bacterium]|nr:SUMF1/EgtB/PvdO family nonheme iron enzyme [Anaerolineae bacterium]
MNDEQDDFVPQFDQDEPEPDGRAVDPQDDWEGKSRKETPGEYAIRRHSDSWTERTPVAGSTRPFQPLDTPSSPEPTPTEPQFEPLQDAPADFPVMSRPGQRYFSDTPDVPATVETPVRRRQIPIVVLLLAIGCVCFFAVSSLVMWAYLTNSLPLQLAGLVDSTPTGVLTELPSKEAVTSTATHTPGKQTRPTHTSTPAVFITLLSTRTPGSPEEETNTPSATATRTPRASVTPVASTQEVSPAPTLVAASTLTPDIVADGQNITQSGVSMVSVPGGKFVMGIDNGTVASPAHEVILSPFYIDEYEVTNQLWAACVDAGACSPPGSMNNHANEPYYGVEAFNAYPVFYVNWFSADAYCRWRGARLPTEAEWEKAARWNPDTGTVTFYPWGDVWDRTRLNYCDSSCALDEMIDLSYDDGWPQTAPVGTFPNGMSPVGALDMAGNVTEWVADWYSSSYYAIAPAENPTGPATGTTKGVRGGAWSLNSALTSSIVRARFDPSTQSAGIGFRCAISAGSVKP